MRIFKLEVMVIDFDEIGEKGIRSALHNARYPNRCISPEVMDAESVDIGEWDDGSPLNFPHTKDAEYKRLFKEKKDG